METEYSDHLSDDALIELLDLRVADDTLEELRRHVDACPACARRLEIARDRWAAVATLLTDLDHARAEDHLPSAFAKVPRSRWRGSPSGRTIRAAAAATLVLGAAALASTPLGASVGEWLSGRWSEITGHFGGGGTGEVASAGGRPATAVEDGAAIVFGADGATVRLSFAVPQERGELLVAWSDAPMARLQQEPPAADSATTPMLVLPDGVEIRNESDPGNSYRIDMPRAASTLELRVGGRPARVVERPRSPAPERRVERVPIR